MANNNPDVFFQKHAFDPNLGAKKVNPLSGPAVKFFSTDKTLSWELYKAIYPLRALLDEEGDNHDE